MRRYAVERGHDEGWPGDFAGRVGRVCERWKIVELSVIDSGPTDDADAAIEFLVRFQPEVMRRYADAVALEQELADLVGRDVEVVDYRSVVDWSDHTIRRKAMLESAQTVYAA